MFATATTHKWPFMSALVGLRTVRTREDCGHGRPHAVKREKADRDCITLCVLDDLGLLSGEGCVTDWGLVEQAERLRSGWA